MKNWIMHVVTDSPLPGLCDVHTHGLESYGLMDLRTVTNNPEVASYMIDRVANFMIDGDEFNPMALHWIDEEDGTSALNFVIEGITGNDDGESLYLVLNWYNPDFKFPSIDDMPSYGNAGELLKKYKNA